jgi:GT2 family glycosyltransferase
MNDYDVIIVNYNGEKILAECLDSIYASSKKPKNIIIYDNNSKDGSVELIKKKFPEIILIEGAENIGFGRANNEAMKASESEFILFMNNDLLLDQNCSSELLKAFDRKELALLCPVIYKGWEKSEKSDVYAFGAAVNRSGFAYGLFDRRGDRDDLACFSGACFMARSEIIKKYNFEKRFFLYYEEPDVSIKVLRAGMKIGRIEKAKCYHLESYSSEGKSIAAGIAFRQFYGTQNRWFIVGKFWPLKLLLPAIFTNQIHLFYLAFYYLAHRTYKYLPLVYLAHFSFWAGVRQRESKQIKNPNWYKNLDNMSLYQYLILGRRVFDKKRYNLFKSD